MKRRTKQSLDGELGLIIDEMARAMWNADKEYIATRIGITAMTPNMHIALTKFQDFCGEHYGK